MLINTANKVEKMMKSIFSSLNFWLSLYSSFVSFSSIVTAQDTQTSPQENTTQKICTSDPVESLLPPLPGQTRSNNSILSYLAAQGFTQSEEGSWVCYVNDAKKRGVTIPYLKFKKSMAS